MVIKGHGEVEGNRIILARAMEGKEIEKTGIGKCSKNGKGKKKKNKSQVICILLP